MSDMQTILVPTDFSTCSDVAMNAAADLASDLGAGIELMHVVQIPYLTGWEDGSGSGTAAAAVIDAWRKDTAKQLEDRAARLRERGLSVETRHLDGSPHEEIKRRSGTVDLIVMGTHGRSGLPRALLGSVAERVVRVAQCPVMTVPVRD